MKRTFNEKIIKLEHQLQIRALLVLTDIGKREVKLNYERDQNNQKMVSNHIKCQICLPIYI